MGDYDEVVPDSEDEGLVLDKPRYQPLPSPSIAVLASRSEIESFATRPVYQTPTPSRLNDSISQFPATGFTTGADQILPTPVSLGISNFTLMLPDDPNAVTPPTRKSRPAPKPRFKKAIPPSGPVIGNDAIASSSLMENISMFTTDPTSNANTNTNAHAAMSIPPHSNIPSSSTTAHSVFADHANAFELERDMSEIPRLKISGAALQQAGAFVTSNIIDISSDDEPVNLPKRRTPAGKSKVATPASSKEKGKAKASYDDDKDFSDDDDYGTSRKTKPKPKAAGKTKSKGRISARLLAVSDDELNLSPAPLSNGREHEHEHAESPIAVGPPKIKKTRKKAAKEPKLNTSIKSNEFIDDDADDDGNVHDNAPPINSQETSAPQPPLHPSSYSAYPSSANREVVGETPSPPPISRKRKASNSDSGAGPSANTSKSRKRILLSPGAEDDDGPPIAAFETPRDEAIGAKTSNASGPADADAFIAADPDDDSDFVDSTAKTTKGKKAKKAPAPKKGAKSKDGAAPKAAAKGKGKGKKAGKAAVEVFVEIVSPPRVMNPEDEVEKEKEKSQSKDKSKGKEKQVEPDRDDDKENDAHIDAPRTPQKPRSPTPPKLTTPPHRHTAKKALTTPPRSRSTITKSRESLTVSDILKMANPGGSGSAGPIRRIGLSKGVRIVSLHSNLRTPPKAPPPMPKKKVKKKDDDDIDSEEEYEGLTEAQIRKKREEKKKMAWYSP